MLDSSVIRSCMHCIISFFWGFMSLAEGFHFSALVAFINCNGNDIMEWDNEIKEDGVRAYNVCDMSA